MEFDKYGTEISNHVAAVENKKTISKIDNSKLASLRIQLNYQNLKKDLAISFAPINIYDHRISKFVFVNEQFAQLIGHSLADCYTQDLNDFTTWMHAGDLSIMQSQIGNQLSNLYKEFVHDKNAQLFYTLNYRLKIKDHLGEPISVLSQCSVIEWTDDFKPALTLNSHTDLTHYQHNQKMLLQVNLFDVKSQQWKMILSNTFLHEPDNLGKREKEIMIEMLLDKSATTIAKEKNMSVFTIRSHWRNVLQKTNCVNQKQLKQLAQKEGWI